MNKILTIVLIALLLFLSFWFGESGKGIFQISPYISLLLGVAIITTLYSQNKKKRIISGVLLSLLYLLFFYSGTISFYKAFNSCVQNSEEVRAALLIYKERNGNFPTSLNLLGTDLPGKRLTRKNLLNYSQTENGYKINFSDWLIEYSATESEEFMARK